LREKVGNKKTLILSKEDIDSIFSNVDEILGVHKALLSDLIAVQAKWPRCQGLCAQINKILTHLEGIGKAFNKRAQDFRVYSQYVNNFKHAQNTLVSSTDNNPKFRAFLDEVLISHSINFDFMYLDLRGDATTHVGIA